jgi:hypothetical protein
LEGAVLLGERKMKISEDMSLPNVLRRAMEKMALNDTQGIEVDAEVRKAVNKFKTSLNEIQSRCLPEVR